MPSAAGKLPGDEAEWKPAAAVKNQNFLSADIRDKLAGAAERAANGRFVRVALVTADPLMRGLGRPIRDQVVTTRPESFTTLEALDLTNGAILAGLLARGADNLAGQSQRLDRRPGDRVHLSEFFVPAANAGRA